MLGQDLDTGAGVGVVQGLESQVCQRDVPLALVLLMATGDGGREGKDGRMQKYRRRIRNAVSQRRIQ